MQLDQFLIHLFTAWAKEVSPFQGDENSMPASLPLLIDFFGKAENCVRKK